MIIDFSAGNIFPQHPYQPFQTSSAAPYKMQLHFYSLSGILALPVAQECERQHSAKLFPLPF
jgi:hypothetical protein